MKVTDVKKGHFVFIPRADRPASYRELHDAVVKAGYDIEGTSIEVRGTLTSDGRFEAAGTRQTFELSGPALAKLHREASPGAALTLTGPWRSGPNGGELIEVEHWELGR